MRFVLAFVLTLALALIADRVGEPAIAWLQRSAAPYWQKLLGVYITVVAFIVLFATVPGAIVALAGDGTVHTASWTEPLPLRRFILGSLRVANMGGLMGVGVRLAYDLARRVRRA